MRFQPEELGIAPGDRAAQLGVVTTTSYDDGERASHHAGGFYMEQSESGWQVNNEPSIDETAIIETSELTMDEAAVPMTMPSSSTELLERMRADGLEIPKDSLVFNQTKESPPARSARAGTGGASALLASLTVNFCFNQGSTFADGGVGEDVWPETTNTLRPAMGQAVILTPSAGPGYSGYLNASGCTGNISVDPASWTAAIYSVGYASRYVYAETCLDGGGTPGDECNGNSSGSSITLNVGSVTTSGTKTTSFTPTGVGWRNFNIAALGLFAVNRNPGTASVTYEFRSSAPTSWYDGPLIWIATNDYYRKWLIGHEMGHRFFSENAPLVPWDSVNTYEVADTDPQCQSTATTHGISTKENSSSAFTEAIASFYAAVTFNNSTPAGTDCWFEGTVDCEEADVSGNLAVLAWMENQCPGNDAGSPPMPGMGVEVDWLRALWNVHTGGNSTVALNSMLPWVNVSVPTWTKNNAYQVLDTSANIGGATPLNNNWDSASVTHGIDH